jgi:glycosyltransferase involved in cell wall biosynthesis
MNEKKVLIIHDRFQFRGGAERLVLVLARAFQADILTEFWIDGDTFDRKDAPGQIFTLAKKDLNKDVLRYFRSQLCFIFKTRKIIRQGGYDTIIFSGNNSMSAVLHVKKGQKFILYSHTPMRHVFDLYQKFRSEQKNIFKRLVYYDIGSFFLRRIYKFWLSKFPKVVTNAENTKQRFQKYCDRANVGIVRPPIDTEHFKWIDQGDYYLSFGRVDKLKRVGDIVRAFQKMPDKKLIVSSSGDDFENIKELAAGHDNIKILGWVSDEELVGLVGNCIASLYVPIDEDAGMCQLESMSAGKPVICNFDGGFKETVTDEVDGKFVPKDYQIVDIIEAVSWMSPARAIEMKENCFKKADKFSHQYFIDNFKKHLDV